MIKERLMVARRRIANGLKTVGWIVVLAIVIALALAIANNLFGGTAGPKLSVERFGACATAKDGGGQVILKGKHFSHNHAVELLINKARIANVTTDNSGDFAKVLSCAGRDAGTVAVTAVDPLSGDDISSHFTVDRYVK